MEQADFSIIHDKGEVTFVRNRTAAQKRSSVKGQSIKVQCFDSSQVDRVFRIQEIQSRRESQQPKASVLKKILHF